MAWRVLVKEGDEDAPIELELYNAPGIVAMISLAPGSDPQDFDRAVDALVGLKDMMVKKQPQQIARRPSPEYRRPRNRR